MDTISLQHFWQWVNRQDCQREGVTSTSQTSRCHTLRWRHSCRRHRFQRAWKRRFEVETEKDDLQCLGRSRLRTGHRRLLPPLYRFNLSPGNEGPRGTGSQTPEHIVQGCPAYRDVRRQTWSGEVELQERLWGSVAALRKTAAFIIRTGLTT